MEQFVTRGSTERLTRIWQRVLGCDSVGIHDNFFELGGDSVKAAALFSEIAKETGRKLLPLTILQAPTIAAMAELLDQSGNVRIPPLLLLRPGEVAPPVYITHGIGSSVMDLFNLVHSLDTPHPVCGMQARGMDSLDEPFDRIEDMADYFLDAIKTVQPHGPYILVGYSLGGLVTLEMARRLTERGEKLALLALLETYPHRRHLSLGPRIQLASQLARHHVAMLGKVPVLSIPNYLFGGSAYRMKVSEELFEQAQNGSAGFTPTRATRKVHEKSYSALMRYRPPAYEGRIRFIRAATSLRFPKSPSAAWAGRLPGLEIETVPGTHQSIIAADSATLAAVLSRYLREASA